MHQNMYPIIELDFHELKGIENNVQFLITLWKYVKEKTFNKY
jgi:hypothetical protein